MLVNDGRSFLSNSLVCTFALCMNTRCGILTAANNNIRAEQWG